MPRHSRTPASSELTVTLSIPVGSTLREARQQLALRTLASTGGDVARAAGILGITAAELRTEMATLLEDPPAETRSLGGPTAGGAPPVDEGSPDAAQGANGAGAQHVRPSPIQATPKKVTGKRVR